MFLSRHESFVDKVAPEDHVQRLDWNTPDLILKFTNSEFGLSIGYFSLILDFQVHTGNIEWYCSRHVMWNLNLRILKITSF